MLLPYLQVIIQAATEVHLSEGHVRQLGVEEDAELCADVQGSPLGRRLLVGRNGHTLVKKGPEMLLQRQTQTCPLQVSPVGGVVLTYSLPQVI